GEAIGEAAEVRRLDEIRPVDRLAQQRPELLLVAHQEDPAVLGAIELARRERGMARARLARLAVSLVQVPGREIAQILQCAVEEAHIDVAANPRLPRSDDA